jgi:hypothetical protein
VLIDDTGAERLDALCDLVQPAQDRARELAGKQVIAAGGQRHDVGSRRCSSEVGKDAVRRVAVAREVDELRAEPMRELRHRSATVHAGVVVDGDAVTESEIDAHRDAYIVAKQATRDAVTRGPTEEAKQQVSPDRHGSAVE